MLRAEEPLVLRHELEELRVLELQVVEARDVADVELVLDGEREELDVLQPGEPRGVSAHGGRKHGVDHRVTVQREVHDLRARHLDGRRRLGLAATATCVRVGVGVRLGSG